MNVRHIIATAFGATLLINILGCLGGPDVGEDYPMDVSIEYIVTSTSPWASCEITYTNHTGGDTVVDAADLPFSATVDATVEEYDVFRVMTYCHGESLDDLTVEIKVDGVSVEREVQFNDNFALLSHVVY